MKTSKLLFLLSLALTTLSCCKRDDEPMQEFTLLLPQEVKDYLLFKPGTYWVYPNSKTMELDSVYITEVDTSMRNTFDEENNISMDYQYLEVVAYSNFEKYYTVFHFNVPFPTNAIKSDYKHSIRKSRTRPGDYVGETVFLVSPIKLGQVALLFNPNGQQKRLILEEIIPALNLNTNTFSDVLVFNNEEDWTYDGKNIRYYVARNVGIIKKEFVNDGESWELIRYHIEQ